MNAKLIFKEETSKYEFRITLDEKEYDAAIYTNAKGKFIDDGIFHDGIELIPEGEEGEIREKIIDYLDKNWDSLVK